PAPACKCGGPRVIPRLARDALLLGPARHVLHERLPEAPRWWAVIMYPVVRSPSSPKPGTGPALAPLPSGAYQLAGLPMPLDQEDSDMKARAPVLLIDDHDDVREGLRMLLEADGWIVETARDGREALNKIAGGLRPCIILLELMSPVMNGLEF